jgi:hypothetical protein
MTEAGEIEIFLAGHRQSKTFLALPPRLLLCSGAVQQQFGSGVKLSPGQTVEYVYMNSESDVPNDRVRAFALWEGWHGYYRKKYKAMLREAFGAGGKENCLVEIFMRLICHESISFGYGS